MMMLNSSYTHNKAKHVGVSNSFPWCLMNSVTILVSRIQHTVLWHTKQNGGHGEVCPLAEQTLKHLGACGDEEKKVGKILLQVTKVYNFIIYFS